MGERGRRWQGENGDARWSWGSVITKTESKWEGAVKSGKKRSRRCAVPRRWKEEEDGVGGGG